MEWTDLSDNAKNILEWLDPPYGWQSSIFLQVGNTYTPSRTKITKDILDECKLWCNCNKKYADVLYSDDKVLIIKGK